MIGMRVEAPDLDRQINLLKFYPEVIEKHFKQLLVVDTSKLWSTIRGTIPKRTGAAQAKFRRSVTGKGINLTGRVGWWGSNQPWYINVVEHGAKPHTITAKPGKMLRLQGGVFAKSVHHPGLSARGFMAAGYSALQPMINADMQAAAEAVLNEMQVS